jgi:hypothetical protein
MTKISVAFKYLTLFSLIMISNLTARTQSWSAMPGGGMNDWVYASVVYNGDLIVGGLFTSAGGVSTNHIARWDGISWTPLGSGVNGKVNALTVYKGNLVAAGEFTNAGGLDVNFIAQWNGTEWDDQLGGVGSTVTSLAVIGNDLFVGGYFTEADNTPVNYVAKRNSGGWVSLAGGMGGLQGQVMALTVHNGELYAGGFFTTAGGAGANHIARWDGTSWSPLGSGIGNIVYALSEYNGNLIAGGLFLTAGGTPANNIASWNGTSWSAMGGGMEGIFYQYVFALSVYQGNLIAGGYFTTTDGLPTNGIAKWNGTSWSGLGGGFFYPANVYGAHTLCIYGTDLIAGGLFSSAGGVGASHIASWNEPVVPATLSLQNEIVGAGAATCYSATQTITVAGNGTTFLVQDLGSATLIASQNIQLLPGTTIEPGGYLLASITTSGQYCGSLKSQNTSLTDPDMRQAGLSGSEMFKVYPNPASSMVNIEISEPQVSPAFAEIISMRGEKVGSVTFHGEKKRQLSLDNYPAGIYFLRLTAAQQTFTSKLIKID